MGIEKLICKTSCAAEQQPGVTETIQQPHEWTQKEIILPQFGFVVIFRHKPSEKPKPEIAD